jgi:copper chaperone CopZ
MKKTILITVILSACCLSTLAEGTVKLSHVHLCCNSCVKGVDKAVASVSGVTAESDKDEGTVTIKAPDTATAQKAVDALVKAGYFGSSGNPSVKVKSSNEKVGKVQNLKLSGVHLCCGKCVSSVNDALSKVDGVKGNTATKGAETFEVTGDFKGEDVLSALNKAGLAGKVAQ